MTPVERPTSPLPGQIYRQLGVQLWGRGAYEREELEGSQTRYKTLSRVEAGDIVVNKIWARNGSVAVVSSELSGCYVSGEFPTFAPLPAKLEPAWFHWYSKTPALWRQCDEKSRGTSGKNRIRPEKFLEIEIPLPNIDEQRRIVSRIEEMAAKLEEARMLRHGALTAVEKLVTAEAESCFRTLVVNNGIRKFSDFAPHVTSGPRNWGAYYSDSGTRFYRAQDVSADFQIGDGSKVYVSAPTNGQAEGAKLQSGDLMLVITGATVGRCTVFPSGGEPGLVNQHVALCRFPKESVVPEYVLWGLRSEGGQKQLLGQRYGQGKPGLNLNNIRSLELPFPSIEVQRRTVVYLDSFRAKVECLRKHQSETAAELNALMPSILYKAFRGEV
ncbi:MAG: restriction endonuclease subunit S [Candidatus Acidiferrum sp.]